MRARFLLLTALLATSLAYAADDPEPLTLEFLEFLELLGEEGTQDEMVDLLIAAEGKSASDLPEAGANDDE
jgi:hypothetical protein